MTFDKKAVGKNDTVPEKTENVQQQMIYLDVNDFIYPGEKVTLVLSVIALLIITFALVGITVGWFLLGIVGIIFWTKVDQGTYLSHCVKVTNQQFPDIHKLVVLAAQRLSVKTPDVFVKQDPTLNAFAIGLFGRECIVMHSALVEALSEEELLSTIGHELAHLKCHHTKWGAFMSGSPTAIPLISDLFSLLFLYWGRKAEHTCDRGGLLCTRNIKADVSAFAKLAIGDKLFEQLNLEEFMKQKLDYDKELFPRIGELLSTHPNLLNRINELRRFHASEQYQRLTGESPLLNGESFETYDSSSLSINAEQMQTTANVAGRVFLYLFEYLATAFFLACSVGIGFFASVIAINPPAAQDISVLAVLFMLSMVFLGLITLIYPRFQRSLDKKGIPTKNSFATYKLTIMILVIAVLLSIFTVMKSQFI